MVFLNINYENYLYKIKMYGFIIIYIYIIVMESFDVTKKNMKE